MTLGAAVDVVGESHYPDAVAALLIETPFLAFLRPDPHNPYDPQAVAVVASTGQVGHLSRDDARRYRPVIDHAIRSAGHAAVWAVCAGPGGARGITLDPEAAGPMSRRTIVRILADAGYQSANRDADLAGYGVQALDDGSGFRVLWLAGNGPARDDMIPAMAKTLREAGYQAKTHRDTGGYATVRVTGHGP